jgi:hypothetical protein
VCHQYTFFCGKRNENFEFGTFFFLDERIIPSFTMAEFRSDRMYIILRGRWCHIVVLNVRPETNDKIDDGKDNFYEELGRVYDKFIKYDMKITVRRFQFQSKHEDICKQRVTMKVYTKLVMISRS